MRRKIIILCMTIFLILSCSSTVFAQEFDPQKTGSISVTLTDQQDNSPIVGAKLRLYYVATVCANSDGNLSYAYTKPFRNSEIDLNDPALTTKLDAFVTEQNPDAITVTTDENGRASLKNLALGLYFMKQTGSVEGYSPCTPFTVTVPQKNADGFTYEVNASPKTEVKKLITVTVKKVWNVDEMSKAADHVTVQLLHNGNVIKTAILNEQNHWQVTYVDLPASDGYSIQEIDVPTGFTATYSNVGYVFTVTNTSDLIHTGQRIWPIPLLAGSGVLLLAVGIILLQKKRKTNA